MPLKESLTTKVNKFKTMRGVFCASIFFINNLIQAPSLLIFTTPPKTARDQLVFMLLKTNERHRL